VRFPFLQPKFVSSVLCVTGLDEVIFFFINFFLKNWTNFIKIANDINPAFDEGRLTRAMRGKKVRRKNMREKHTGQKENVVDKFCTLP